VTGAVAGGAAYLVVLMVTGEMSRAEISAAQGLLRR